MSAADLPLGAVDLGPAPAAAPMKVNVLLTMRDRADFDRDRAAIGDPTSPLYRHQFTSQQLADMFAPYPSTVDGVANYFRTFGLTSRLVTRFGPLDLTGSAAQFSAAFQTTFHSERTGNRPGWMNVTPASLPHSLDAAVAGITGLANVDGPHPASGSASVGSCTSSTGGQYELGDIEGAYSIKTSQLQTPNDLNALQQGSGTIGVLAFGQPSIPDVNFFWTQENFLLTTPIITETVVSGTPPTDCDNAREATLDIEWSGGVAPFANMHVYEAANDNTDAENAYARLASDNAVDEATVSWFWDYEELNSLGNLGVQSSIDQSVAQMTMEGITLFNSSGDKGAWDYSGKFGVEYPAANPQVVGVGGTSIPLEDVYAPGSEAAWSCANFTICETATGGSGGGSAPGYSSPVYQNGTGDFSPSSGRAVPDVSLLADPNDTAYNVRFQGQDFAIGGTSVSAPVWAGILAVYHQFAGKSSTQHSLSPAGPFNLYTAWRITFLTANSAFNDIDAGTNGGFNAGVGYDRVTGVGSPNGLRLFQELQSISA